MASARPTDTHVDPGAPHSLLVDLSCLRDMLKVALEVVAQRQPAVEAVVVTVEGAAANQELEGAAEDRSTTEFQL